MAYEGELVMSEQNYSRIAKRIADKIKESKKSNAQLAKESGLSYVTVYNLRNQKIAMPAAGTIMAISKALGIKKSELEELLS